MEMKWLRLQFRRFGSAIRSYLDGVGKDLQHFENTIWLGSVDATEQDWKLITDMQALQDDFRVEPVFCGKGYV